MVERKPNPGGVGLSPGVAIVEPGGMASPTRSRFRLGYRPALDGVRAIAVLLVVAVHVVYLLVPEWGGKYVPGGFVGVGMFFVLSGFLITSLLLEEWDRDRRISLRNFYRRRARRLFPALYFVMLIDLIYAKVTHLSLKSELKGLAAIGFYVGNWSWKFGARMPLELSQAWSLGVEEQFYLIWPLILLGLLTTRNRKLAVGLMTALVAVGVASRAALFHAGVPWDTVFQETEVYLDALMFGALLAWALHLGWRPGRWIQALGWSGVAFIGLFSLRAHRTDSWVFYWGYTAAALGSAFLICAVLDDRSILARVLSIRPAQLIGRISYSIYLWHFFIFVAVSQHVTNRSVAYRLTLGLGLTLVASVFSYYVIEKPFRRHKRGREHAIGPDGDSDDRSALAAGPVAQGMPSVC